MSSKGDGDVPAPVRFTIVTMPRCIIGAIILVGIAINCANVIGRYVFLEPIIWAEEIMIYIMVWTVFIGSVLVSFEGQHLKMDFFSILLPSPWKETINFIAVIATLGVCVFVVPQAWTVVQLMWDNEQRSVVAEIPMVIPHFALLLGFILMFVAVAIRFRAHVRGDLASGIDEIAGEYGDGADAGPSGR